MRFQFQPVKMDNTDMTTHFEKRHVCGWSFPLLPVGVSWQTSSRIQRFIWYVHARLQYCDRYLAREQFWNPNLVPIILHASLNKSKLLISRVMQTTCRQRQRTGAGWWAQTSVKQELCAGLQPALRSGMFLWWLCRCLQKHRVWWTTLIMFTMRPEQHFTSHPQRQGNCSLLVLTPKFTIVIIHGSPQNIQMATWQIKYFPFKTKTKFQFLSKSSWTQTWKYILDRENGAGNERRKCPNILLNFKSFLQRGNDSFPWI